MFFAVEPAFAALPELGPRTVALLRAAPSRRRDRPARQPARAVPARVRAGPGDARPAGAGRAAAGRRRYPRPAELGEPRGRPGRAAARGRAGGDPRRRGPRDRRRRPAGHSLHRDRPARLRDVGRVDASSAPEPCRRRWYVHLPNAPRRAPDDRPAARLLRPLPRRGRPGGRRRARRRARPPAADAGDDRLGELRAAVDPRVPGLGPDQQVRRGLPRQALLRRLRARRRDRAARDRPREGAVRRRARQRPAARRRAGQRRRLPRAAAAGRHDPGPRARRTAATSPTA